jgi:valyl-tRNA synthetase
MWMPGTDHAGIATQMLVERQIKRDENLSRHDLGRDKFLERVWAWKEEYGGKIHAQERQMGFSLDWERERFTMDPGASLAVREVFVRLHEEGLIYRAHRLVNWCTDCFTAVSDLEVDNVEERGKLWELRYPITGSDRWIAVATTRPETMLGDTGVAVHPDDERYKDVIGATVDLPLTGRTIPIVADTFVDPEFGSGAVKVTPGHDLNDFECGQRCGLEVLDVIDRHGRMQAPAPDKYVGMTVTEARDAVVADLEAAGLLGEVVDYTVPRGRCDRSNTVIEPLLSDQWWVKTEPLARPAIAAVEQSRTVFVPQMWTKTYMHWMTNIKDWCISRQLWWGHRIPAWYCDDCDHITVSRADPSSCGGCGGAKIRQDEDVLDTWFSSALWPFSTLGWPEKTRELQTFYPNAVLVTGPDIIFFWVARMMMMGLHFMGDVPFREVFLTPIVTDADGEKMSKVKGNVTNPLDVVRGASLDELLEGAVDHPAAAKYFKKNLPRGIPAAGADALRFSLAAMTMPGRNIRLQMERIEGYRNFVNKIWNASRFCLMNLEGFEADRFARASAEGPPAALSMVDRWIFSRLQRVAEIVNNALGEYRFSEAANALYHFVWHELCDWYIELAKAALAGGDAEDARFAAQGTLARVLDASLRMLHPFMPHVTEEIWQRIPHPAGQPASLMITVYPSPSPKWIDETAEATMDLLQEITGKIRTIRSTYNVPPSQRVAVTCAVADAGKRALIEEHAAVIRHTARVDLELVESAELPAQSAKGVVGADIEVIVPLAGLVDIDAEKQRIAKEIGKAEKEIGFLTKKLDNPKFVERAPAEVVDEQRERLDAEKERKQRLAEALEALG